MGVVNFGRAKQGSQGVVAGNDEAGQVCQQLTTEVENNEEKIESSNANDSVDLGNRRLLLEIVEDRVFAQLQINDQFWPIKETCCDRNEGVPRDRAGKYTAGHDPGPTCFVGYQRG